MAGPAVAFRNRWSIPWHDVPLPTCALRGPNALGNGHLWLAKADVSQPVASRRGECHSTPGGVGFAFDSETHVLEAGGVEERCNLVVCVIQQMALLREGLLCHRWHVAPELIAESEPAARSKEAMKLLQLGSGFVPEVQDMRGKHEIDRSQFAD